jgi:hypothetical protein
MKRTGFAPRTKPLRSIAPAKAELPTSRCCAKGCRVRFVKLSMGHRACSVEHARLVVAQDKAEKARKDARDHREARAEAKPLSHHHRLTKDAVHAYIRQRDAELPCISCDTLNPSAWHAGHYMSVGSESALRYDPANIHRQCSACNVHKGSNAIQYRIRLVQRIGIAEVERLEGPQPVIKWTREGLKAIREEFRALARGEKV